MFKGTRIAALAAMLLSTPFQAFAQDVTAKTVVANVNGTDITVGHMIVLRQNLPEQYQSLPPQVLFDGVLDQLVQQSVLAQSVETASVALELRLENERRSLMASEALAKVLQNVVSEDAIQKAYEEQFATVTPSQEFNASHILVETEDEAAALIKNLADGADFAELAKEKSTGPSGQNGGELGWFGPGMMVKPFEDAVMAMDVGALSAPVQTQFGWHVLILNDKRLLEAPAIDEVRTELVAELQEQAIDAIVADLTAAANVSRPDVSAIDPDILNNQDLVQ